MIKTRSQIVSLRARIKAECSKHTAPGKTLRPEIVLRYIQHNLVPDGNCSPEERELIRLLKADLR